MNPVSHTDTVEKLHDLAPKDILQPLSTATLLGQV